MICDDVVTDTHMSSDCEWFQLSILLSPVCNSGVTALPLLQRQPLNVRIPTPSLHYKNMAIMAFSHNEVMSASYPREVFIFFSQVIMNISQSTPEYLVVNMDYVRFIL